MLLLSAPSAPELVLETDAHEGPVYLESDHALYFTTSRPDVAIRRLELASGELTTVCADANNANGMTLGHDGRLIVCEQGSLTQRAAITAIDPRSGSREVLVDHWHGLPLNSPNDVVVASDGSIWFTDPSYGHRQGFRPRPVLGDRVYRFDPESGELWSVVNGLDKPNGLAFSPSESVLYVGDNGRPPPPVRLRRAGPVSRGPAPVRRARVGAPRRREGRRARPRARHHGRRHRCLRPGRPAPPAHRAARSRQLRLRTRRRPRAARPAPHAGRADRLVARGGRQGASARSSARSA